MITRISLALPVATVLVVAALAAPATAAVINGTSGDDTLVGTNRADTIRGFAGNDVLQGRRGEDKLYGGPGADRLYGGMDSERRAWPDVYYAGPGPDLVRARSFDVVHAGRGNDTIKVSGSEIKVFCGPGDDRVVIAQGSAFIGLVGCEHKIG